jgi:hypothetical protein
MAGRRDAAKPPLLLAFYVDPMSKATIGDNLVSIIYIGHFKQQQKGRYNLSIEVGNIECRYLPK